MKNLEIDALKNSIGKKVRVVGRSISNRYVVEGTLEEIDRTTPRACSLKIRVRPATQEGNGLIQVGGSHLVSVKVLEGASSP